MGAAGWVFRTLGSLVLVLGLVYLTSLLLRALPRRGGARPGRAGLAGVIRVLDSVALTPTATLHVVEVEDKRVVVGAAGSSISCLLELGGPVGSGAGTGSRGQPTPGSGAADRPDDAAGGTSGLGPVATAVSSLADVATWGRRCLDRLGNLRRRLTTEDRGEGADQSGGGSRWKER